MDNSGDNFFNVLFNSFGSFVKVWILQSKRTFAAQKAKGGPHEN